MSSMSTVEDNANPAFGAASADQPHEAVDGQKPSDEMGTESVVFLQDIAIRVMLPSGAYLQVPNPMLASETFAQVRQYLTDFQESAHFTNYHLKLQQLRNADGDVIPMSLDSAAVECYDYLEVSSCFATASAAAEDPSVLSTIAAIDLSMVADLYDAKKALMQLKRTNEIIQNPPTLKAITPTTVAAKSAKNNGSVEQKNPETDTAALQQPPLQHVLQPCELGNFYDQLLVQPSAVTLNVLQQDESQRTALTTAVRSVFASGWNPPEANRRSRGDLLYVEAVLAQEGTIHLTATPSGFFVNRSNRSHFDPTPAAQSCVANTLMESLLAASSSLRAAWTQMQAIGKSTVASVAGTTTSSGSEEQQQLNDDNANPLQALAKVYVQSRGENILQKQQWNAFALGDSQQQQQRGEVKAYDLHAAQEQLSSLYSVEELGATREWNDEIQAIRSLAVSDDINEKVMKARLEYKVITEFTQACKTITVAICDGMIAPLAIADPMQSDIFVYNGIFFSKAEDAKDTFKICNGDAAYAKCMGRELQNQRLVRGLNIDGLSTVLCCVVDYKGQRFIGQSILPGILSQGENMATLQYGILDRNTIVTVKNSSLPLMKAIAEKLYIPQRAMKLVPFAAEESTTAATAVEANIVDKPRTLMEVLEGKEQAGPIRIDDSDNIVAAGARSVPHYGPIESKILKGSDGRNYVLELMRLTPRDANFVKGAKGSGKIAKELLEATDDDLNVVYVLRHELVSIFVQNRLNQTRQKLLYEATERERSRQSPNPDSGSNAATAADTATTPASATSAAAASDPAAIAAAATASKESKVVSVRGRDGDDDDDSHSAREDDDSDGSPNMPPLDEASQLKIASDCAEKMRDITPANLGIEVNPNCFLDFDFDVESTIREKDESLAREMASFLWDTMLPAVTHQIREGDSEQQPKDAAAMVDWLHQMGVNVRYVGALAMLAEQQEDEDANLLMQGKQRVNMMPLYWREMLVVEVVARAVKHVLNGMMKTDAAVAAAPAQTIASLLNHVLSVLWSSDEYTSQVATDSAVIAAAPTAVADSQQQLAANTSEPAAVSSAASKKNKKKKNSNSKSTAVVVQAKIIDTSAGFIEPDAAVQREGVLRSVEATIRKRYCIDLVLLFDASASVAAITAVVNAPATAVANGEQQSAPKFTNQQKFASFFRTRISPLTLLRRICQLTGVSVVTKSYKFSPPAAAATKQQQQSVHCIFTAADIVGVFPIAKSCEPDVLLRESVELLQNSSACLQQGRHAAAYEMAQQASALCNQVTGPLHKSAQQAMEQVISVLLSVGDAPAALQLTAKSLAVAVQYGGLDSHEVYAHHLRLALLQAEVGDSVAATRHFLAAKYLLQVMAGDRHCELANIFARLAALYDRSGNADVAQALLLHARRFTNELLHNTLLLISLADLCFRHGQLHQAMEMQKNCYKVLKDLFGADDDRLTEVKSVLEKYIRAANDASKQSKEAFTRQLQEQIALLDQQAELQQTQQLQPQQELKTAPVPYNLDDEDEDFNAEGAYRRGKKKPTAATAGGTAAPGGSSGTGKKSKSKK